MLARMDTPAPAPGPDNVPPPIPPEAFQPSPAASQPQPVFSMVDASGMVVVTRKCVSCSYNLMGLMGDSLCPECGTPVANSLRDNLLINSSPVYLARIHKGVFLVQAGIIVMILLFIGSMLGTMVAGFLMAAAGGGGGTGWMYVVIFASAAATLVIAGMSLYGWWLLSEADPRANDNDRGESPRRIVRITVIIECFMLAASQGISLVSTFIFGGAWATGIGTGAGGTGGAAGVAGTALVIAALSSVLTLGYYVALAVRYFASMLYLRWLAPRLPNNKAHQRAKLMLWLGPVLCTVGIALCGLGPVIALIMYYNLLEWFRIDLKRIRKTLEVKTAMTSMSQNPGQPA